MISFKKFLTEISIWSRDKKTSKKVFDRFIEKKGLDYDDKDDGQLENLLPATRDKVSFRKLVRIYLNGKYFGMTLRDFWEPSFEQKVYDIFDAKGYMDYIPLELITSNQYFVSAGVTKDKMMGRISKKKNNPFYPYVLKIGNLYHLIDGNHQANAARVQNQGLLYCKVLDINKVTKESPDE